MANLVQPHGAKMRPALEAGRQMMAAGFSLRWDGAVAERANVRFASGRGRLDGGNGLFDATR